MSYYHKSKYILTHHSILRIKQRLNLKEENELLIKVEINKMIEKSKYSFQTSKYEYIKIKGNDIFLVVDRLNNLIITATPISNTKQLWLIENE